MFKVKAIIVKTKYSKYIYSKLPSVDTPLAYNVDKHF